MTYIWFILSCSYATLPSVAWDLTWWFACISKKLDFYIGGTMHHKIGWPHLNKL